MLKIIKYIISLFFNKKNKDITTKDITIEDKEISMSTFELNDKKPKLISIVNEELLPLSGGKTVNDLQVIVNHWTAAPKQSAFVTMHYCIFTTGRTYHYFVDHDGTIYEFTKFPNRAIHCGANVYTQDAITRFPQYCPPTDHRVIPHKNSPNNCTLGICGAVLDIDGNMTEDCYNSLVLINARSIVKFKPNANIFNDIVLHSFFTDEKECHKFFVRNPDKFIKFKQDIRNAVQSYSDSLFDIVLDEGIKINKDGTITKISL